MGGPSRRSEAPKSGSRRASRFGSVSTSWCSSTSTPHNEHEETRAAALADLQWQMENRPGTPGALALLTLNVIGWEPAWKTHAGQRLSDRDGQVRWAAVWVLGCQRQHRYMKRIEELLSDRLDLVRHAALCALAVLAPERRAEWSYWAFERAHADSLEEAGLRLVG